MKSDSLFYVLVWSVMLLLQHLTTSHFTKLCPTLPFLIPGGDAADVRYIRLNGREVPVTANLEVALRALRKPEEDCCFWIDALCINQHDIQERNSEVPRMRDMYERADLVVAWHGQGNARGDRFHQLEQGGHIGANRENYDGRGEDQNLVGDD